MLQRLLAGLVAAVLIAVANDAQAACTVTYTFASGTTAVASQVNQNFADLVNCWSNGTTTFTNGTLAGTTNLPGSGVITSTGTIGIGTTSPAALVNIVAVNDEPWAFSIRNNSVSTSDTVAFRIYQDNGGITHFYNNNLNSINLDRIGNVGIATTSPRNKLDVGGYLRSTNSGIPSAGVGIGAFYDTAAADGIIETYDYTGSAYKNTDIFGTAVTLHNTSDRRLKTNIFDLQNDTGMARIMALRPVTYTWRDKSQSNATQIGLIAQDVQQVFPSLVSPAPNPITVTLPDGTTESISGVLTVNYEGLIVPIVKAVQHSN